MRRWTVVSKVPSDTCNPMGRRGAHPPSLNTTWWPIVEQYCEGKVKRTPEGEWKEPETLCLQAHKALRVYTVRCGTFCRMVRRVYVCSEVKCLRHGAVGKPSVNSALSCMYKTRNRVTYPCPGWSSGKTGWRAEPTPVEKLADEVWIAEKFQSNPDIAGSPRNSFRASLIYIYRR